MGEGPQLEGPGPGDAAFDQERITFVQWILSLLGYNPSKPPVHPPPEPIDQSKCAPCSKYYFWPCTSMSLSPTFAAKFTSSKRNAAGEIFYITLLQKRTKCDSIMVEIKH